MSRCHGVTVSRTQKWSPKMAIFTGDWALETSFQDYLEGSQDYLEAKSVPGPNLIITTTYELLPVVTTHY